MALFESYERRIDRINSVLHWILGGYEKWQAYHYSTLRKDIQMVLKL